MTETALSAAIDHELREIVARHYVKQRGYHHDSDKTIEKIMAGNAAAAVPMTVVLSAMRDVIGRRRGPT